MKNFNLAALTKYLRVIKYGERLRPARDWLVLISIAFVLLLMSIGWNVWLFYKLANGQAIGSAQTTKPASTPTVTVTGVQKVFQQRANQEASYANSYHFVDPSVPGS